MIIGCNSSNDFQGDKNLLGKYLIDGFNSGIELELKKDGTFEYETQIWGCTGGGEIQKTIGNFQLDSNLLKLNPLTRTDILYSDFDIKYSKKINF